MTMTKLTKFFLSKELIVRLAVVVLIIAGITIKNYSFYYLLASGILLGTYYGLYNDIIWRPNGKLEGELPYRAHQVWIHIIGGVIGSISLYFLLGAVDFNNPSAALANFGLREFILFVITLFGYVGLLPQILWYFSFAQSMFSSKLR